MKKLLLVLVLGLTTNLSHAYVQLYCGVNTDISNTFNEHDILREKVTKY